MEPQSFSGWWVEAAELKEKGLSFRAIGARLGKDGSEVRRALEDRLPKFAREFQRRQAYNRLGKIGYWRGLIDWESHFKGMRAKQAADLKRRVWPFRRDRLPEWLELSDEVGHYRMNQPVVDKYRKGIRLLLDEDYSFAQAARAAGLNENRFRKAIARPTSKGIGKISGEKVDIGFRLMDSDTWDRVQGKFPGKPLGRMKSGFRIVAGKTAPDPKWGSFCKQVCKLRLNKPPYSLKRITRDPTLRKLGADLGLKQIGIGLIREILDNEEYAHLDLAGRKLWKEAHAAGRRKVQ